MKIIIKSISLVNFKGLREMSVTFKENETDIAGANKTGKTTIADAISWVFFGKDTKGRTQFNLKTRDINGVETPHLEHSVTIVINIDGKDYTLKRSLVENWTKAFGSNVTILKNNSTECFINGNKRTVKGYQAFIDEILQEDKFRILTNPVTFTSLPWEEQRRMLTEMCCPPSAQQVLDVIQVGEEMKKVILTALEDKSPDEYRKHLSDLAREIKNTLQQIPVRINEAMRNVPEPQLEWESLDEEIKTAEEAVNKINEQLSLASPAIVITDAEKRIDFLKRRKSNMEISAGDQAARAMAEKERNIAEAKNQIADAERMVKAALNTITTAEAVIKRIAEQQGILEDKKNRIREEWAKVTARKFTIDPMAAICPYCGQQLPADKLQETINKMKANFQTAKRADYEELTRQANEVKKDIETCDNELASRIEDKNNAYASIEALNEKIEQQKEAIAKEEQRHMPTEDELLEANPNYKDVLSSLQREQRAFAEQGRDEQKELLKNQLQSDFAEMQKRLQRLMESKSQRYFYQVSTSRVQELNTKREELNKQLTAVEMEQDALDAFIRKYDDLLEVEANKGFQLVKFKLFRTLVNGERLPYCEATIDGVPFSDLNTASKINAGIDIINTLAKHIGIFPPVIIDNAEAVNNILPTPSQRICLYVTKDPRLTVL